MNGREYRRVSIVVILTISSTKHVRILKDFLFRSFCLSDRAVSLLVVLVGRLIRANMSPQDSGMIVHRDSFGPRGYVLVSALFIAVVIAGIVIGAVSMFPSSIHLSC